MNLRQAIALDHKHARSHNNLALVLAQNGRTNDALAEFHMGGSDHASAHANLAFVLTMANRLDLARAEYQHALAANPSSSELKIRIQQLDTLAAKLTPSRDKIAATQDPRVMTASAEIAPQPPSPTRVSSPQTLAVNISSPARPLSGPVPGHSHTTLPIGTAHVTRGVTTSPAPATIPASKALAAPQAVSAANASKPIASISRPTTQHVATKPQLSGSGRPSALLPPSVDVKAPGAAQTYSTRPGSSHPVIPPPQSKLVQTVKVHEPAQRRANAPARTQSIPPLQTNLPGADSAANNAQASQFSTSPSLESAR